MNPYVCAPQTDTIQTAPVAAVNNEIEYLAVGACVHGQVKGRCIHQSQIVDAEIGDLKKLSLVGRWQQQSSALSPWSSAKSWACRELSIRENARTEEESHPYLLSIPALTSVAAQFQRLPEPKVTHPCETHIRTPEQHLSSSHCKTQSHQSTE